MENKKAFKERKQAALDAARSQGIIDVVVAGNKDIVSPETVELAAKLMQKHGKAAYERLEARAHSQT